MGRNKRRTIREHARTKPPAPLQGAGGTGAVVPRAALEDSLTLGFVPSPFQGEFAERLLQANSGFVPAGSGLGHAITASVRHFGRASL